MHSIRFSQLFYQLRSFLFAVLLPQQCFSCRKEGQSLCHECLDRIPFQVVQMCPLCKKPRQDGTCCPFPCREMSFLDALISACPYVKGNILSQALFRFKYFFLSDIGHILAYLLVHAFDIHLSQLTEDSPNSWIIVPVPLSKSRLKWRGFNQSEILAQAFCKARNFSLVKALSRSHYATSQTFLHRQDRLKNVSCQFYCTVSLQNMNVFIIDDISTTGATLQECAKVLKNAGCRKVVGLVLGRGV